MGSGADGEIADHVLQYLCELDIQRRLLLLDVGSHVGE